MIKLKDILSEIGTDPKTVFGNIVFGDPLNYGSTEFAAIQNMEPTEYNTKEENEILNLLRTWVQEDEDEEPPYDKLYSYFDLFKSATSKFPRIFKPKTPPGTVLYRGLRLSSDSIFEQLRDTKREDYEAIQSNDMYHKYKNPIKYVPSEPIQSWSSELSVAFEFAQKWDFTRGVVLITQQNNQFLFNQDALRILSETFDEQEVIHFGKEYSDEIYVAIHRKLYKHIIFGEPLK
jgi:hypothetical protein